MNINRRHLGRQIRRERKLFVDLVQCNHRLGFEYLESLSEPVQRAIRKKQKRFNKKKV